MLKKIKQHWIENDENRQNSPTSGAILIGAADDRGVLNVGGRLGAGHGPHAIRQMLSQFMLGIDGAIEKVPLLKGHDVELGNRIEDGHAAMRHSIKQSLLEGLIPIAIGGGHDYGYPHIAGASDAFARKVALINVDAHLDVRPPGPLGITSGSPFFLALESGVVEARHFVEFGIQEHCNDKSYAEYLSRKSAQIMMLDETRSRHGVVGNFERLINKYARQGLRVVVSFDVDAVQMAYAPGVSAPQSDGFTPAEFFEMTRICGEHRSVATIGFFELAPSLDEHQKTTRLVATAIHRFLSGLSRRGERSRRHQKRGRMRRLLYPALK